ncbi:MAG: hypothetical protein Kapaf2KO_19150 [Candidatus Kapaibacteriales bacterium]
MTKIFLVFAVGFVAFFSAKTQSVVSVTSIADRDSLMNELRTSDVLAASIAPHILFMSGIRLDFEYRPAGWQTSFFVAPQVYVDQDDNTYLFTDIGDFQMTGFGTDFGIKYYLEPLRKDLNVYLGVVGSILRMNFQHPQSAFAPRINEDGVEVFVLVPNLAQESTLQRLTGELHIGGMYIIQGRFFTEAWLATGLIDSEIVAQRFAGDTNLLNDDPYFQNGVFYGVGVKLGILFDL